MIEKVIIMGAAGVIFTTSMSISAATGAIG
jgi:hypothetical protein